MFGFFDILSITINGTAECVSGEFNKYFIKQPGQMTWVCFLPWRTNIKTAQKYKLLPKSGDLIVYEVPDNLLGSTPQLTLSSFEKIKQDFESVFKKEGLANKELAFLGLSAGTIPAFYLANSYKCKKLTVACPTTKLGEGIFKTFAARHIKRKR